MTMMATIGVGDMFVSLHAIQSLDLNELKLIYELHFTDVAHGAHQVIPTEGEADAFKLLATWIMAGEDLDFSFKSHRERLYAMLGDSGPHFLP